MMISRLTACTSILTILGVSACSVDTHYPTETPISETVYETPTTETQQALNLTSLKNAFPKENIVGEVRTVPCTLSGGTETECLSLTISPAPTDFTIGPWCPRNITDGPDVSGIWLDEGRVYDADGDFIQNLDEFYRDDAWQLFDPVTGKINVTETRASCEAAARPDVDPAYQNYCVECRIEDLDPGLSQTFVIPLTPSVTSGSTALGGHGLAGLAFSGVRLDAPAPLDAILSAYTIAPFDDCGGHVNLNVGYHIHAATDCLVSIPSVEGHADMIGIAMDGFPLFQHDDTLTGLDSCGGHESDGLGYHYHVGDAGSNQILGCHVGETGCALDAPDEVCDASQSARRGPPGGREGRENGDRPPRGEGRPPRPDR